MWEIDFFPSAIWTRFDKERGFNDFEVQVKRVFKSERKVAPELEQFYSKRLDCSNFYFSSLKIFDEKY